MSTNLISSFCALKFGWKKHPVMWPGNHLCHEKPTFKRAKRVSLFRWNLVTKFVPTKILSTVNWYRYWLDRFINLIFCEIMNHISPNPVSFQKKFEWFLNFGCFFYTLAPPTSWPRTQLSLCDVEMLDPDFCKHRAGLPRPKWPWKLRKLQCHHGPLN